MVQTRYHEQSMIQQIIISLTEMAINFIIVIFLQMNLGVMCHEISLQDIILIFDQRIIPFIHCMYIPTILETIEQTILQSMDLLHKKNDIRSDDDLPREIINGLGIRILMKVEIKCTSSMEKVIEMSSRWQVEVEQESIYQHYSVPKHHQIYFLFSHNTLTEC